MPKDLDLKHQADGICGICRGNVPSTNANLFYCSEECRRQAWAHFHPEDEEPDWDSIPRAVYY